MAVAGVGTHTTGVMREGGVGEMQLASQTSQARRGDHVSRSHRAGGGLRKQVTQGGGGTT